MSSLTQSQSILLGKVLEKSIAPMLDNLGIDYAFSQPYDELLTRPDFLIKKDGVPVAAIAVTCTQDNQTMNKKRWRYIDEVFQLKSYFGAQFLTINCEFGDHSAYMQSEMTLANVFFDASLLVFDYPGGSAFLDKAIELVQARRETAEAITQILTCSEQWKTISKPLMSELTKILSERKMLAAHSEFLPIWKNEHNTFRKALSEIKGRTFFETSSYLRYAVLGGLVAGEECMKELLTANKQGQKLSPNAVAGCKRAGFEVSERIGGTVLSDSKILCTIHEGLTYEIYSRIEECLLSYPPVKYVVRDIRSPDLVLKMVQQTLKVLSKKDVFQSALFDAFRDDEYIGIAHDRTWLLDVVLLYLNVPTNYLNRLFIQRYGRAVIATKMEHYISKTDCGRLLFADDEFLNNFCNNMTELVFDEAGRNRVIMSESELTSLYINKKIKTLGNQPFVNPLHRFVELVFQDHNLSFSKNSIPCALSGIAGIPSTMSSIHEVYQIRVGEKEYWVKAIAGYDGVKDKTREMAARGRLLQYDSPLSPKRDTTMVFVTDGHWSTDLQQLLTLSGWTNIVPVFKFDGFIKGLLGKR